MIKTRYRHPHFRPGLCAHAACAGVSPVRGPVVVADRVSGRRGRRRAAPPARIGSVPDCWSRCSSSVSTRSCGCTRPTRTCSGARPGRPRADRAGLSDGGTVHLTRRPRIRPGRKAFTRLRHQSRRGVLVRNDSADLGWHVVSTTTPFRRPDNHHRPYDLPARRRGRRQAHGGHPHGGCRRLHRRGLLMAVGASYTPRLRGNRRRAPALDGSTRSSMAPNPRPGRAAARGSSPPQRC